MKDNLLISESDITLEWCSEDFIYNSLRSFLKENGYKVQKDGSTGDGEIASRKIIASKLFKKEIIEVKGYPNFYSNLGQPVESVRNSSAKNWFTDALFNSFINFSITDNAEVAIALPNVGRYQAIVEKLTSYFTVNDLYFKIYMVNKDGSVDIANLNEKFSKAKYLKQSQLTI